MKIPFDIRYRQKIESGEYKVVTRENDATARIICWDADRDGYSPLFPIIALIEGYPHQYTIGGRHEKGGEDSIFDLFVVPECLNELETELCQMMYDWEDTGEMAEDIAKEHEDAVLDAARKVLSQWVVSNMLKENLTGIEHDLVEYFSNAVYGDWGDVMKSTKAYAERIKNEKK